jgi:hypothetical protein
LENVNDSRFNGRKVLELAPIDDRIDANPNNLKIRIYVTEINPPAVAIATMDRSVAEAIPQLDPSEVQGDFVEVEIIKS